MSEGPRKPGSPAKRITRRKFLKRSAIAGAAGAALAGGSYWLGSVNRVPRTLGKKVIVIGIDGMDPVLCERMMDAGELPHLAKLRGVDGFDRLSTSVPPQSPVAWANFINGAGPGTHGIFDFVHRHPHEQCSNPFYSAAETLPGDGYLEWGEHKVRLNFWPFNHTPPETVLRRQGTPFWHYLDAAGVPSTFYDLPCNYPPSPSEYGNHRSISGMGTPDLLGTYGTYQHFSEDGPPAPVDEAGGRRSKVTFHAETARAKLVGPMNDGLLSPRPTEINFHIHRDLRANSVLVEIQGQRIVLEDGEWSDWTRLAFRFEAPGLDRSVWGICRFYVQEVAPNFRMYVTPINVDPSAPAVRMSEPDSFLTNVSDDLGLFYTAGFQEDHKARSNGIFDDAEFIKQTGIVLEERLALLEYALNDYDDGLLFFYFSSSDLQSHILWWDSDDPHPTKPESAVRSNFAHIRKLYRKLDAVIGDIVQRYGDRATIIAMSDHGFANFGRQFNLNTWLRDNGYLGPPNCTSLMRDVDWSKTYAYGLGINGLYVNVKGRERDGIVEPGEQKEFVMADLVARLPQVRDVNGEQVIRNVYRADEIYHGDATALAPDLIVGYRRGYRASWATTLGDITPEILHDNDSAWSADHCADALEVPGVVFANRAIKRRGPSLVDIAPSILAEYGLKAPSTMIGKNIFA